MSTSQKRKTPPLPEDHETSVKRRFVESGSAPTDGNQEVPVTVSTQPDQLTPATTRSSPEPTPSEGASMTDAAPPAQQSRLERFKALQARQSASRAQNLRETQREAQRLGTDQALLNSLSRKHATASQKLLKAETEAAGDNFERKRAWDWTVEESEKWDRRMAKKERHRQDVAFADYTQAARKTYKRQMRDFVPDLDKYGREKMRAVERAAAAGELEIVEMDDGELVAVDREGGFLASTGDAAVFAQNEPDKEAVDRLVAEIKKAEEVRLKKRREKYKEGDDGGDVTYINLKNKQFNDKLRRFYDKYTTDIRESFERGTAV